MTTLSKQSVMPSPITIPYGFCHCGCGMMAPVAKHTIASRGQRKGDPVKYCTNHRRSLPRGESFLDAEPFKIRGVYCKLIPLTKGYYAVVNADRHAYLSRWKWYASWSESVHGFYAVRNERKSDGETRPVLMHRVVSGVPDGIDCDHKDGNMLMNVDLNLRPANDSQNSSNRPKQSNNTSGYKGVSRSDSRNGYKSRITVNRVEEHIGSYSTAIEAALAYDLRAVEVHGEFACLNFPKKDEVIA